MCVFSKPKAPTVSQAPMPTPPPTPTSVESNVGNDSQRRAALERMRRGLASTIRTSPRGISGGGADLISQSTSGKTKLGV